MTFHLIASWRRAFAVATACALALAGCVAPPATAPGSAASQLPEGASGYSAKPGWSAERFMVAAANPLAAEAGFKILEAGGSALDAAIAVQMVLALVEPQSSGIGGGAFLLHADGREVQAWDGRETAPDEADERLFLRADGQPMNFFDALLGGRAVGVPGSVRMLEAAHRQHGKLPWARLFEPAIALAEEGFALGPRLHALLQAEPSLRNDALARAYFFDAAGSAKPVGSRLRNPALAEVLRAIAARGSVALHEGAVAADIVARVRGHANPGRMSPADLAAYAPRRREPICTDWTALYHVCGMPPPSSGHLAMMQILGLLERLPAGEPALDAATRTPSAEFVHRYAEAARLAFADRALYIADPDFIPAPMGDWTSLLDPRYLDRRALLVGRERMNQAPAGTPGGVASALSAQAAAPEFGTSHLSVVDGQGHAVAMTSSIEYAFGAHLMSDGGSGKPGGFLLNNQLTDFSFAPTGADGRPIANRVQPGKRPRSSMSPTLVFDKRDGRLLLSVGSSGGATIIHHTAKTLLGSLAWGLDTQRAIDLPNFASGEEPVLLLEKGRWPRATREALAARGHRVVEIEMSSGLQAVQRTPQGWFGAADPRREGMAMGQ